MPTAKINLTCKNDASHKISYDATVTVGSTSAGSCQQVGTTTYKASYEGFTQTGLSDAVNGAYGAHTIVKVNAQAETCTEYGWNEHYQCTVEGCGKLFGDAQGTNKIEFSDVKIEAAHKYSALVPQVDATCVAEGKIAHYTCDACKTLFDKDKKVVTDLTIGIDEDAHDLENHEAKAPTCTEIGWDAYESCKREGCEYTTYVEKSALGHTLTHYDAVTAICNKQGNIEYWYCSVCNGYFEDEACTKVTTAEDVKTTDANNHDFTGEYIYNGTDKTHNKLCKNGCGTYTEAESCTMKVSDSKTATCFDGGHTTYTCDVCKQGYTDTFSAIGHKNKVHHEAVTAVCNKAGNIEYWYCPDCKANYSDEACTDKVDSVVTTAPDNHDYTDKTWTSDNNGNHYMDCTRCDDSGRKSEECTGGTATCMSAKICTVCNTAYGDVDSTNHKYTTYTSNNDAKCGVDGTKTASCDYGCNEKSTITDTGSALTHAYTVFVSYTWNYETEDKVPTATITLACVHDESHKESYVADVTIHSTSAGSCQEQGTTTYIAKYDGYTETSISTAVSGAYGAHTIVKVEYVAETCTEDGYNAHYKCTVENCGKLFKDEEGKIETTLEAETIKASHKWNADFTVDTKATCEADGSKSIHCSACEETKDATVIAKRAHKYVDTTVQTPATCVAEGVMNTKCSNEATDEHEACTHKSTREIPVDTNAHDLENHEAQASTCTVKGWDAYVTCKREGCNYTTKTLKDIDENNHVKLTATPAKEADCSTEGNKAYWTCDACGDMFLDADAKTPTDTEAVKTTAPDNHDYDTITDETNLTRPVYDETTGEWSKGYYTHKCSRDENHETKEYVDRADYTEYDKAVKALEDLLTTDITDTAKENIREALETNKVRDDLIVPEQDQIKNPTANLEQAFKDNNTLKTYKVEFVADGKVVDTQTIISGNDATAPATDPTKDPDATSHYFFKEWIGSYTNITADTTITADWTIEGHKGGTATCTEKAKCEVCQTLYGSTAPDNHDFTKQSQDGKYLKSEATCMAEAVYYYGCTRCDAVAETTYTFGEKDLENHTEQNTTTKDAVEATCTTDGKHADTYCECGEKIATGGTIGAYGHNWTDKVFDWSTDGKTCTVTITCERTCVEKFENVAATAAVTQNQTCTDPELTDYTVTVTTSDQKTFTDVKEGVETKPMSGHSYTADFKWTAIEGEAPTCKVTLTCVKDDSTIADIEADVTEYAKDTWVDVDCTTDGKQYYKATATYDNVSYVSDTYTVTITRFGHDFTDDTDETSLKSAANCTDDEVYYLGCSRCNEVSTDDSETWTKAGTKWNHKFEGEIHKEADGKHSFKCTNTDCDVYGGAVDCTYTDEYEAITGEINHTAYCVCGNTTVEACTDLATDKDCNCDKCGALVAHTPGEWVETTEPTCTTKGEETLYCSVCNEVLDTREVNADGHSYTAVVTAPTCTSKGYTTYTCHCGDTYTDNEVNALGHDYTDADWTNDGKGNHYKDCTRCGDKGRTSEACSDVAADKDCNCDKCGILVAHDYGDATCTEPATCKVCGATTGEAIGHDWESAAYTWATDYSSCTVVVKCSRGCEETHTDVATTSVVSQGQTCTLPELTDYTVSGKTKDGKYDFTKTEADVQTKAVAGHDYETETKWFGGEDGKKPTATITFDCKNCDKAAETLDMVVDEIDKDAWVDATCDTDGTSYYKAHVSYDGKSYTTPTKEITVTRLGHDLVTTAAQAPTCTAGGWNEYVTCKRDGCGYSTFEENKLPAIEHKNKEHYDAVTALCNKNGNIEYWYCPDCDANYSDKACTVKVDSVVTTDPNNHKFTNYVYDGNATCTDNGTKTAVCANGCGETNTIADPDYEAHGHNYEFASFAWDYSTAVPTCTVNLVCSHNGKHTDTAIADVGFASYDEGDCQTLESTTYKATYGKETELSAPVNGTNYGPHNIEYVPATGDGQTEGNIARCECTIKGCDKLYADEEGTTPVEPEDVVVKGEHNYTAVVTDPTCTSNGYTTYTCSRCGDSYVGDETEWVSHTQGETVTENHVDATCGKAGSYDEVVYCTECNFEMSRETVTVSALPHTEGEAKPENIVEATCQMGGSYDMVIRCTVCGKVLSSIHYTTLKADSHSFTKYNSDKNASCFENGTKTAFCDYGCGAKSTVVDGGSAIGKHTWSDWTVERYATCTVYEIISRTCTVCKEKEAYENIDGGYASHALIIIEGKEASCEFDGLTDYSYCVECGLKTEAQVIPAFGHKDGDGNGSCDHCFKDLTPQEGDGCICHKGNIFSKIVRFIYTLFSKLFRKRITCCPDMEFYGGGIGDIT